MIGGGGGGLGSEKFETAVGDVFPGVFAVPQTFAQNVLIAVKVGQQNGHPQLASETLENFPVAVFTEGGVNQHRFPTGEGAAGFFGQGQVGGIGALPGDVRPPVRGQLCDQATCGVRVMGDVAVRGEPGGACAVSKVRAGALG